MSDEEWTAADDVIEVVWEARRRLWERFDNDPGKYMDYMRQLHARLVRAGWKEVPLPGGDEGKSAA